MDMKDPTKIMMNYWETCEKGKPFLKIKKKNLKGGGEEK
jgi:hypothetical protein